MKKEKLVAILTEKGRFDSMLVSARASAEEIERTISEVYPLDGIQWMEIREISMQSLKTLNNTFGKRCTARP